MRGQGHENGLVLRRPDGFEPLEFGHIPGIRLGRLLHQLPPIAAGFPAGVNRLPFAVAFSQNEHARRNKNGIDKSSFARQPLQKLRVCQPRGSKDQDQRRAQAPLSLPATTCR
jgi:hypothetical protein